jgi:hypothetical protein
MMASSETPLPSKIGVWGGCIRKWFFFPSNDNAHYHVRNEIEALILFFKYKIASILKLTYKFSIHLIFDLLLLSKCSYKEWITETVCSEIKFIFQICQLECSQSLFSGHPTNVPNIPPSRCLWPDLSMGQAGNLGSESPKSKSCNIWLLLFTFLRPISFHIFYVLWLLKACRLT